VRHVDPACVAVLMSFCSISGRSTHVNRLRTEFDNGAYDFLRALR
jgi:hypothetical protein